MIKISKVEFLDNLVVVRYFKGQEQNEEMLLAREIAIANTYNPEAVALIAEYVSRLVLGAEEDLYEEE